MLDTIHAIETPEGVSIDLKPAGPSSRAVAWVIDLAIRLTLLFFVGIIFTLAMGNTGYGLWLILFFLAEWLYFVFFEVWWKGQTPGKKIMGLSVINKDGTPVSWGPSLLRNLLRVADSMPLIPINPESPPILPLYGLGFLVCLLNKRFQRLGDMAAGTLVVYTQETTHNVVVLPEAQPTPPPESLSLQEQKALITFGERSGRLSEARTAELADVLTPLTGKNGWDGAQKLFNFAAWFMGNRK